jgi:hypothetical protein
MKHITVLHILKSKSLFLLNHEDNGRDWSLSEHSQHWSNNLGGLKGIFMLHNRMVFTMNCTC